MNETDNEDPSELDLEGFVPDEQDTGEGGGGLSALDNAPVQGTPAIGGLAAADPQQALSLGTQRLNQLAEIKKIREQMAQQAAIRREAMQKYTSAYETAPQSGGDAGLAALGHSLATNPRAMAGYTGGMQALIENRNKLAEREWARQVGGQKLRAETEQQGVVDLQNQAKLAESGLGGAGGMKSYAASKPFRATDPNDKLLHEYQNIWDMDTQRYIKTDLGVVPSNELKSGEHLRAGYQWVDINDHSRGQMKIPEMVPIDPNDPSKGTKPKGETPLEVDPIKGVGGWDYDAIRERAIRYVNGDSTVWQGLPTREEGNVIKTAINNMAKEIRKESGVDPSDMTANAQQQRAITGSLLQITKQKTAIEGYENTAKLNADVALEQSNKVDRTGVPILNKWIQAGRKQVTGADDLNAFHAANETFVTEYAKVMSGGYGAAATSEGATKRANTLINEAMTQESYEKNIKLLKREMDNRMKGLDNAIDNLKSTRPNVGAKKAAPAAGATASQFTPPPNTPPMNAKGWELHHDKFGNWAYVSPDKTQHESIK